VQLLTDRRSSECLGSLAAARQICHNCTHMFDTSLLSRTPYLLWIVPSLLLLLSAYDLRQQQKWKSLKEDYSQRRQEAWTSEMLRNALDRRNRHCDYRNALGSNFMHLPCYRCREASPYRHPRMSLGPSGLRLRDCLNFHL